MSTELITNGTIIQMPNHIQDNTSLVHVIKRANGLTVSDRRILLDDLLRGLFHMMESDELTRLLFDEGDHSSLHEIFMPILYSGNTDVLVKVLELLLDHCQLDIHMSLVTSILDAVSKKFDPSLISEDNLERLLTSILKHVKRLDNDKVFQDFFLTLLKKIDIINGKTELILVLLNQLGQRITNEKDLVVKAWFQEQIASFLPDQKTFVSPLLPEGTIIYQEELSGMKTVAIAVAKLQRDIIYYNTCYSNVGHPKMIFVFKVAKNYIQACYVYALKSHEVTKGESNLYHYPFGNVFSDSKACWPEISNFKISQLTQLRNLPELFFKSPTNDHLFKGKNLRDRLIGLQDKDFDDETLEHTGLTLSQKFELLNDKNESDMEE